MPNDTEFRQFLRGLAADAHLGRYVQPLANQSAEYVVLHLVRALAAVDERTVAPGRPGHLIATEVRG